MGYNKEGFSYSPDRLRCALTIAMEIHKNQKYRGLIEGKSAEPYIMHIFRVVDLVSDRAKVVAALHDCLEDGGWLPKGLTVAETVAINVLTHDRGPYQHYINRLDRYPGEIGDVAREVKIADLTTNMKHDPDNKIGKQEEWLKAYEKLSRKY